ncbi:MAG: pentapeptide repeat-containing protein [Rhodopila sp.]
MLLHFVVLSGKIGAYDSALLAQMPDQVEMRQSLRRQLPSSIFVQFLAGPREVRHGIIGFLLKLIAWISLVIGPLILFLFFQLQFLPYHDETVTWSQRIFVLLDLVLVWLLWPKVLLVRADETARSRIVLVTERILCGVVSLLVLAIPFGIATFPGEWLTARLPSNPLRAALLEGTVDDITRRPTSPLSNVLVLPGLDAIDRAKFDSEDKIAAVKETLSLRGRHLEGAILYGADLRKADFAGAQLRGVELEGAQLQGADLENAQIQGASLENAQLQGAFLSGAQIQGANLDSAQLQGAFLDGAQLQGAFLDGTKLESADLDSAQLQGAQLIDTQLQGAQLIGTQLQGAFLGRAQLQGVSLKNADLQGAEIRGAFVWRTEAGRESGRR